MKYKIKNIEKWLHLTRFRSEIEGWMNDEVRILSPELQQEGLRLNVIDESQADAIGEMEEVSELECKKCGFVAKSVAGLKAHNRKHK